MIKLHPIRDIVHPFARFFQQSLRIVPFICWMAKDRRYKTIKKLISTGQLETLSEIFDTLPKSVIAKDLGISLDRFNPMINDVQKFGIRNLFRMAVLIEVDELLILNLVYKQYVADKNRKRKTKD